MRTRYLGMDGYEGEMRQYAKSRKMTLIVDIVETALGYPVKVFPLKREYSGIYEVASKINSGGYWELHVLPGKFVTENELCHELMHLVLSLEGWPVHIRSKKIPSNSWNWLLIT